MLPESPRPATLGAVPRTSSVRWASPLTNFLRTHHTFSSASPETTPSVDPEELANMKVICLTALRGHRRLSEQVKLLAEHIQEEEVQQHKQHLDELQEAIFRKVDKSLEEQLKAQLIAMNMNEKYLRARVRRLERRVVHKVSQKQQEWNRQFWDERVHSVVKMSQKRLLQDVDKRLDQMEDRFTLGQQQKKKCREPATVRSVSSLSPRVGYYALEEKAGRRHPHRKPPQALVNRSSEAMPNPVVFSSPYCVEINREESEDVRSLLTEESFKSRKDESKKSPIEKPRWKHPLSQVLCKVGEH